MLAAALAQTTTSDGGAAIGGIFQHFQRRKLPALYEGLNLDDAVIGIGWNLNGPEGVFFNARFHNITGGLGTKASLVSNPQS